MAFQIRISPAAVRSAAQRHHAIAETIAEAASNLTVLANELGDSWDGGSSYQAIDTFHDIRSATEKASETIHESAEMLIGVARAFESLDDGAMAYQAQILKPIYKVGCPAPRPPFIFSITDSLRIEPDRVRFVAQKALQVAEVLAQASDEFQSSVAELSGDWEGNAYNRYADEATGLKRPFAEIISMLEEAADRIRTAANRYEELDQALHGMF